MIPCASSESTRSAITRASVVGFRFIASGNFIWLVSVPYGKRRQQQHPRPCAVRQRAGPRGDHLDLERVGAVRKMEVVRLGRPQRQHRHLERRLRLDLTVVQSRPVAMVASLHRPSDA